MRNKQDPLLQVWYGMKARCLDKTHPSYYRYGGRGIKICERWLKNWKAFKEDAGERPSPEHQLDRINNAGNYEPGNIQWIEKKEHPKKTFHTCELRQGPCVTRSVWVSASVWDELKTRARELQRSVNWVVRDLLEKQLAQLNQESIDEEKT